MKSTFVCSVLLVLLCKGSLLADDSWVGRKVMLDVNAVVRKYNNEQVLYDYPSFIVVGDYGDNLLIKIGWVAKDDVVPVEDAPAHFRSYIEMHPDEWVGYHRHGIACFLNKDYVSTIADMTECLRRMPIDYEAYYWRVNAFIKEGKVDEAIADANESLRLMPGAAYVIESRGVAYASRGDFDKAIADLNEAARLMPGRCYPFCNLACVYAEKGDASLAMQNLQKAFDLGYRDFEEIESEHDFDSLRHDARFIELIKSAKEKQAQAKP